MHYRGPSIPKANFKKRSKQIILNLLGFGPSFSKSSW